MFDKGVEHSEKMQFVWLKLGESSKNNIYDSSKVCFVWCTHYSSIEGSLDNKFNSRGVGIAQFNVTTPNGKTPEVRPLIT